MRQYLVKWHGGDLNAKNTTIQFLGIRDGSEQLKDQFHSEIQTIIDWIP